MTKYSNVKTFLGFVLIIVGLSLGSGIERWINFDEICLWICYDLTENHCLFFYINKYKNFKKIGINILFSIKKSLNFILIHNDFIKKKTLKISSNLKIGVVNYRYNLSTTSHLNSIF